MSDTKVWSHCNNCNKKTNHEVIYKHEVPGPEEYHCRTDYSIVKCMGCDRVSFRYLFNDFEEAFQTGPDHDDWDYPVEEKTYPLEIHNSGIDDLSYVPEIVQDIYNETLSALKEQALTLAGLGFRATIEAICNDQNIPGRNLETRITNLWKAGLISKKDSERLHSIRFLGNDAAHDIKTPSKRSIATAQKIIEHMIVTVYILPKEASRTLETVIDDFEQFKTLLKEQLEQYELGDERTIAAFLGKDRRRLLNKLPEFERQLHQEISSNQCNYLTIGTIRAVNGQNLQFYIKP